MTKTLKQRLSPVIGAAAVMAVLLFSAVPVQAALQIVPECARKQGKQAPSLNCALQTFANIGQLILGITGSFALLMFVYGGFTLLTSGGASEKVSKGKTIITNAIIGIVIILTSGLLIQYGLGQLKVQQPAVGLRCTDDNTSDSNGPGTFVLKADGKFGCIVSCTSQLAASHSCAPAAQQAGKTCFFTTDCESSQAQCCTK